MGVPSLYRWLTRRYPEIKVRPQDRGSSTDNLYLDFNAIIHPCCNKSLGSMQETDAELYKNLENYIDEIVARIEPRRLLYISVDGVSPRAKLNQQRSRRFVGAKETTEQGNYYFEDDCGLQPVHHLEREQGEEMPVAGTGVFDTNAISPGTEFMERLDVFIRELISYKMSSSEGWRGFNVIYSSYHSPGEGEQKILEYIRKHQNPAHKAIIYSPDADLIFLGMSLFDYNVMILREDPPVPGASTERVAEKDLVLVDIGRLRGILSQQFRATVKVPFTPRRFLEDWILLCFMVGNDFLPCTPCFEIRTDALDKITSILIVAYTRTRTYITDNGKINHGALKEFFTECARRENSFLADKRANLISTRQRMNIPYDVSDEFFLDSEGGKTRYYVEKMGIKSEQDLLVACQEYVKGLEWVYNYYFYSILSWEWFYPYHFAPFMVDLARLANVNTEFAMGRPLRPLEQLLAVLPPLSRNLLPSSFHPIFDEFPEYYPKTFKVDMFQKCMDWQAVPILPFMRLPAVLEAFEKRQDDVDFGVAERNLLGYPIFFSRQPKVISVVYPLYVELKSSDLVKLDEYVGRAYAMNVFRALEEEVDSCGFKYINRVVRFTFDQRKVVKR